MDALLIASPENIYYLTGLDHMGYFAYQLLVFPARGQPILITRAMERVIVRDQVPDVVHVGYSDGMVPQPAAASEAAAVDQTWGMIAGMPTFALRRRPTPTASAAVRETVRVLRDAGLAHGALAVDQNSSFLPYSIAEGIMAGTPDADWHDLGSLVDNVRIVQSPQELELTRQAAIISESMLLAAVAAAGAGINAREVMAAIYDAMFRRGGTYPGFVPLVQSTRHHCGYSVGIGYPPSWSGSGVPVGLRRDSDMTLSEGMVFHLMSWLLRSDLGVEPAGAATMRNAWDCGDAAASLAEISTIAVSLAPAAVGNYTYAASRRYVDEIVTVGDDAIVEATRLLLSRARLYAETGASVGVAALLEDAVPRDAELATVCIVTGGNMDLEQAAMLAGLASPGPCR